MESVPEENNGNLSLNDGDRRRARRGGTRFRGRGRGRRDERGMEASEEERIGEMQAKGSIPFDNVENSQLADHLVPLSQRREQDIIQEGQDDNRARELSRDEQIQALLDFRDSTANVCTGYAAQTIWEANCISQFEGILHSKAQSETPSGDDIDSRERVIKRIDTLVRAGLSQFTGMHVETYGSYTSGLFTPQGDLDIAIEGVLQLRNSGQGQSSNIPDDVEGLDVSELHKEDKAALLRALVKKIIKANLSLERPQGIFHARVPIIKFVDRETGIPCDMAIGSGGARFKSIVLKQLSMVDPRLADMIRIVKQWAKSWNLNDASDGTFNTFALSLMVVFHLQTRNPPILPPICQLFDQQPGAVTERPLHAGLAVTPDLIQGAPEREKKALEWKKKWGGQNPESLIELFSSFFALYAHVLQVWVANRDQRAIRCCAWAGEWTYKRWRRNHIFPIEDPFDTTDNCARSIFAANAKSVQQAFEQTRQALSHITTLQSMEEILNKVFGQKPKKPSVHPFYGQGTGWRDGWNRRAADNELRRQIPQAREELGDDEFAESHDNEIRSRRDRRRQNSHTNDLNPLKLVYGQVPLSHLPLPSSQLFPPGMIPRDQHSNSPRYMSSSEFSLLQQNHRQLQPQGHHRLSEGSVQNLPPLQSALETQFPAPSQNPIQNAQQQEHLRNLLTGAFKRASISGNKSQSNGSHAIQNSNSNLNLLQQRPPGFENFVVSSRQIPPQGRSQR